ncbi:silent information regulator protein Sir2 [Lachnospiraceae bacterium AM25-11LB]|jgi:hyaluronate lyase|nr:silent information regulator protein Sir2 [Lachnospiraceae bacterium AM25-22]RGD07819.1 silent information regulator protein Sir2 [Lachnospiraceae bacterium AM25-11LB]RJW11355.1 silent information regulator protein Sir2 [Lachnospiraceae bacterium AM25-40]RJW15306.1 silent information regulator protein Sir2 [Lachnospiraceae bacterium AM25-39]
MVTYRNKNGELLKEGGSMKTGKRKNQKYISAMLIAAMSVGNVTGVLAEPVNVVAVNEEQGREVLETVVPTENQDISIVRGESLQLDKPENFSENVTWSAKFLKKDGTFLRNAGYSKIKRELKEGETDGTRKAGDASAEHLLKIEADENGNAVITGENKGNVVVVAQDDQGKTAQWKVEILYQSPSELPSATAEDYGKIRQAWKESLIGKDLASEEGGAEVLEEINQEAEALWNAYVYKGQEACGGIPWAEDEGAKGNKNIPYEDDAVEFRVSFKKVLSMCKAYAAEGGVLYQNQDMLKDITNILDFLCGSCYTAKSQTDNWWTWEIGIPKDLIPALILIYDGLTEEQVIAYTETLYFFQPDPFHEGVINTASTHGQGYREAQGANIIDCSTTAVGLGALREDNELVYLGMLASSQTFVIQNVEDSAQIAANGYNSGFYPDGSYLDHIKVPYLGAYGIEFMKGGAKIPSLLAGTPWKYPEQVQDNLESYIVEGFGNGMYQGMMLDCLKGRSVSRPASSNQAAGREAMMIILQIVDSFSQEAKETTLSALKAWLEEDEGFIDSLVGAGNMAIKKKAKEILEDTSIQSNVSPIHKSYPLMDRAVHRTEDYLFALSMYSERIQNTEIMNDENRFGWHQNNGMTYIYDEDKQYTENYWNTVNPLRLPGTTVVPVNIGTGKPDGSGFAQGGDFCSKESWVGGTSIGNYGVSGMSFSGETQGIAGDAPVSYAPDLKGKKSWFMFDDEIVCLGAGITNKNMELPVETTIENKKLRKDGSNQFLINGEKTELPVKEANVKELVERTADVSGTSFEQVNWAHLEGNQSVGTGYYFPEENTEIQVRRGQTTGSWKDVGTFEGESTENYMEMWVDHGQNPENASYSYVLLPETSAEETENYAQAPKVTILENSSEVQAVRHETLKITGVNFWQEQGGSIDGITSNKAASVMLQETEQGTVKVSVSDPTMKNKGNIQLTLEEEIADCIQLDENVTCEKTENGAVLTFAMAGTNGAASMAELQLVPPVIPQPEEPETPQEPENPEEPSTPEIQETDMLVNKEHGVKLTGEGLTSDMQLSVEKLDKKHADVKLMEKEISKKQQLDNPIEIQLLKDGKEIALPHKAELQLPVSEKYNGKEVVVLSCDNEKVKKLKGKVKDGFVYVEVESLNSFGTILDKAVSSGVDKVKTGDETPLAMLSVMFVVGGTLFVVLKRKKKA